MLATLRRKYTRIVIAAFYALAMVTLGVAHQPASPHASLAQRHLSSAELAEYALPDGTLPILCSGDTSNTDDGGAVQKSTHCNACRLISGPGIIGEPPAVRPVRLATLSGFYPANYTYQPVTRASDNFRSRAPPRRA